MAQTHLSQNLNHPSPCFPQARPPKLLSSPQSPYLFEDKQDARGILTPSNQLNLKQERKKQLLSSSKQQAQKQILTKVQT
jgi:hypothetical protein